MAVTYTPTTNFGAKDTLPTNDPDKVIKGTEFTTEFTAIQTAFSLAAPNASPTFTGTVTIPTADINGGAIDGTVIGGSTPAAATFTSLTATTADINGGNIDGTAIGANSASTGAFTTLTASGDVNFDGGTFFVDASANAVGIGTTNPIEPLDVAGGKIRIGNTKIGHVGSGGDWGMTFETYSGAYFERMRIDSSGNLDLGTTASADRYQNIIATSAKLSFNAGTGFTGSAATSIYNQSAIPLVFGTNNSERARLDASGNLLVGTTSGDFGSRITALSTTSYLFESRRTGTGSEGQMVFVNGNGAVGSIFTNGSATAYNTSSDARLKENIADAEDASSLVDAIKVRQFDWKADGSHQRYGMVAQELLEVAPEAVSQPEDPEAMMGVDYSKLVPMLVKEIQSLRARVAQLEGV